VQAMQKSKVDAAVKLNCGEPSLVGGASDLVGVERLKDTYAFDVCWKVRRDLRDLCGGDATYAGRKDESKCIGSELCGQLCIVKIRISADFDPHDLSG
jgi:hypothetical protein